MSEMLIVLPGLLLLLFGIIAQEYWKEAREFYFRSHDKSLEEKILLEYEKNHKRAMIMFKIVCCAALFCLLTVVLPVLIKGKIVAEFVKWGLTIDSLLLAVLFIRYIFGFYSTKYYKL